MNNAAFEPTSFTGTTQQQSDATLPRDVTKLVQGAAAALAMTALALAASSVAWPLTVPALAAFTCALASLLALRCAGIAQRRMLAARSWLDTATGLANRAGMQALGQQMLARARRARQPFAIVVIDFEDLAEVRDIYGRETAQRVLARVVQRMESLAGPRGLATRTGRTQFTVLMPGAQCDTARQAVQRVLGYPSRVEFDAGRDEIVLVPDIAAETVARDGETVADVYRELAAGLAKQRHLEERRCEWLQRERERHSRPMGLV